MTDIILACGGEFHRDGRTHEGIDKGDILHLMQVRHRGAFYINPVIGAKDRKQYVFVVIKDALPDELLDGFDPTPPEPTAPHKSPRGERAQYLAEAFLEVHGLNPFDGVSVRDSVKGSQAQVDFAMLAASKPELADAIAESLDPDISVKTADFIELDVEDLKDHVKPVETDARAVEFQKLADFHRMQAQVAVAENEKVAIANENAAAMLPAGPLKEMLALRAKEHRDDGQLSVDHAEEYAVWFEGKKTRETALAVEQKARYEGK